MVPITEFIINVQYVNIPGTCFYYILINTLSLGGILDAYMWETYIGPQNPPRWTNELPNHLKQSQMLVGTWMENPRT